MCLFLCPIQRAHSSISHWHFTQWTWKAGLFTHFSEAERGQVTCSRSPSCGWGWPGLTSHGAFKPSGSFQLRMIQRSCLFCGMPSLTTQPRVIALAPELMTHPCSNHQPPITAFQHLCVRQMQMMFHYKSVSLSCLSKNLRNVLFYLYLFRPPAILCCYLHRTKN